MAEKEQILEEIEAEIQKAKGDPEEFEIEVVDEPVQEAKEEAEAKEERQFDTQRLRRSIEVHSDCRLRNVQIPEEWLRALLIQLRTQGAPSTERNAVEAGASRRGFTQKTVHM